MKQQLRILIIDDDDVDRIAVRRLLKFSGDSLVVEEAVNACHGLKMLQTQSFDCAFLDYFLPDSDGLSVLKTVRAADVQTPIVMLTGHGNEQLAVEMIRSGATDYLPKDRMSSETLCHCLHQSIRIADMERERRRAEEALKKSNKRVIDILESISDAFFAIDANWCFSYLNAQAEALLQVKREAVIDTSIWNGSSIRKWITF